MEDNGITVKLPLNALLALLACSVLLNLYLIHQHGFLQVQAQALTRQVTGLPQPTEAAQTRQPTATTAAKPASTTLPPGNLIPKADRAELKFYVMSKCPYGVQVLNGIAPALKQAGSYVDFTVDYIVTDLGGGSFRSLHGQTEVDGDIIELCAAKHYPQDYQYMDLISCMNKNYASIPGNWQACATENNMDSPELKACIEGDEGKQLLTASAAKTKQVGATGSPTMYLNGVRYTGGRATADFLRAICGVLKTKPTACDNIPAASPQAAPAGGC